MKQSYHVIKRKAKGARQTLAAFFQANGQILLPLVELVEQARRLWIRSWTKPAGE